VHLGVVFCEAEWRLFCRVCLGGVFRKGGRSGIRDTARYLASLAGVDTVPDGARWTCDRMFGLGGTWLWTSYWLWLVSWCDDHGFWLGGGGGTCGGKLVSMSRMYFMRYPLSLLRG